MLIIESFIKVIEVKSKECDDVLVLGISSCFFLVYNIVKFIVKNYLNVYVYDNIWGVE